MRPKYTTTGLFGSPVFLAFLVTAALSHGVEKSAIMLPDFVATPDGMAVDPSDGLLVVACPNFADQNKPACLIKVNRMLQVSKWVDVPTLPDTGFACPMGIAFGPDNDLYVCDNQGWSGSANGAFKGRMLRLRIKDGQIVKTTIVASGMEHPNGVRFHDGNIYVTQSMLTKVKDPSGLLLSAVYRFKADDENVKILNTLDDKQIVATFLSQNKNCQYGTDGLVFNSRGELFVGIFGDGAIYKLTFGADGKVASNAIFVKTDLDYALDPKAPDFLEKATKAQMRTTDGLCVDQQDNIWVADFSNNALVKVSGDRSIAVVAQNGDTGGANGDLNEPGEPIYWDGMIVVSNFDAVFGPNHPDKVNKKHEMPATLSVFKM